MVLYVVWCMCVCVWGGRCLKWPGRSRHKWQLSQSWDRNAQLQQKLPYLSLQQCQPLQLVEDRCLRDCSANIWPPQDFRGPWGKNGEGGGQGERWHGEIRSNRILIREAEGLVPFLDMPLPSCGSWTKFLQTSLSVKMIIAGKKARWGSCVCNLLSEYRETRDRIVLLKQNKLRFLQVPPSKSLMWP